MGATCFCNFNYQNQNSSNLVSHIIRSWKFSAPLKLHGIILEELNFVSFVGYYNYIKIIWCLCYSTVIMPWKEEFVDKITLEIYCFSFSWYSENLVLNFWLVSLLLVLLRDCRRRQGADLATNSHENFVYCPGWSFNCGFKVILLNRKVLLSIYIVFACLNLFIDWPINRK